MAKILLVDDDVDFVAMNKAVLEKEGYTVVCAYDGDEGRAKAAAEKPDLIILDVIMKTETDGFYVARDLRSKDETKRIPVIMLTSVNQTVPWRYEPDEVWLPVDDFVEKPAKPKVLVEKVKLMLSRKQ